MAFTQTFLYLSIIMTTISEGFPNLVLIGTRPFILYVPAHQISLRKTFLYFPQLYEMHLSLHPMAFCASYGSSQLTGL